MVSIRVSVVHVPSASGIGVEIGDVRDQAERARVRHEVHVIIARRRGVVHRGGEDGTLKLCIASLVLCYCTLLSHIAPMTAVTFSLYDGPTQFVSLAIDTIGRGTKIGRA